MHLPEVGGEFRLLIAPARHVVMRRRHFAPGLQAARDFAVDGGDDFALFGAVLLLVAQAQQFVFHFFDIRRLRRGNRGQQPRRAVEGAIGVVAAIGLLMRPIVPRVAQFAD